MKKRYRVRITNDDGTTSDVWAFDLQAAREYAAKFPGSRIFAVYTRARSNVYMDEDQYWVEVKDE